jgi:hypothetical protein
MPKKDATWADRHEMAKAANISVRTLFNYKNEGLITAFRIVGKNRIQFNVDAVLDEIGGPAAPRKSRKAETPPAAAPKVTVTITEPASESWTDVQTVDEKGGVKWSEMMEKQREERERHLKKMQTSRTPQKIEEFKPAPDLDPFS